jgi:hypothetical protein
MPPKPKPPPDDPEQSRRFIGIAREIGADAASLLKILCQPR